jgi:hypothetical protein
MDLFEAVHPPLKQEAVDGGARAKDLERNEVLKRRKERNFGFKLFIRTFIQVCAYPFGISLGANSFSFDVVNSLSFQNRLKNDEEGTRETAKDAFKDFCELRREVIKNAFVEWAEKLGPKLAIETRVRPEPTANPSLQDQIRSLDYPDDVEDSVLDLVRDKRLRFTPTRRKGEKGLARWMKPASDPHSPGFVMQFLENRLEVEPADGSALYHTLKELMDGRASRDGRNWVLPAREEGAASTSAILTEFAKALTHKN